MTARFLATVSVAVVVVMVFALAPAKVSGQTSQDADTLRTPWNEPDLQGIWANQTATPLQRPTEYGNREFLTDEERAALDRQRLERALANPGRDQRKEPGSEKDVAGAYNAFWNTQPGDPGSSQTGARTSLVFDPPDGRIPPITPAALERFTAIRDYLAALLIGSSGGDPGPPSPKRLLPPPYYNLERINRSDGPEDRAASERCLGSSLPDFRGFFRIVQSPGYVAIYYEANSGGGNRIIPIDGGAHLPAHMRQWMGDARARWEDDTLVVDTTNFTQKTSYRGSRDNLHLIERYTRVDADTIDYQLTVEDPTIWTAPWSLEVPLTRQDGRQNLIFDSPCHEGNFGMTGMLANQRAAEQSFAEGRGPDPATMDVATGGGSGEPRLGPLGAR